MKMTCKVARDRRAHRIFLKVTLILLSLWVALSEAWLACAASPTEVVTSSQDLTMSEVAHSSLPAATHSGSDPELDLHASEPLRVESPRIIPLVPKHIGLTATGQPVVYFFVSRPTTAPVLFALIDVHSLEVIRAVTLPAPERAGIHAVRLRHHGVTLRPNVEYRWFLSLLVDLAAPVHDEVASGWIERVTPQYASSEVPEPMSLQAVHFYAAQGLWYDAIAVISELIALRPLDETLHRQRAALLHQVDLHEVADWDLRPGQR
ncbi:hypothetical protein YTPLAS18_05570 [Nitrospira sp.]|nr:hypothetical protein YTPLAS18_05570 [Nitrospira sp.]